MILKINDMFINFITKYPNEIPYLSFFTSIHGSYVYLVIDGNKILKEIKVLKLNESTLNPVSIPLTIDLKLDKSYEFLLENKIENKLKNFNHEKTKDKYPILSELSFMNRTELQTMFSVLRITGHKSLQTMTKQKTSVVNNLHIKGTNYSKTDFYKDGVYVKGGYYSNINRNIKNKLLQSDKYPKTNKRHIGIEIEGMCSSISSLMTELFLTENKDILSKVCLGSDGSIRGNTDRQDTFELRLLTDENSFVNDIHKIYKILAKVDFEVNTSCGLHVHLDMRNRNPDMAQENLFNSLSVLTPLSMRGDNLRYCEIPKTLEESKTKRGALNFGSLSKYGTIEVRLLTGVTNPTYLEQWIKLLISIVDANNIKAKVSNKEDFLKLNLSEENINYVQKYS